ncbi:MAG: hypothetical protein GY853_15595 [PVC group bacterium]|nr:hypothetical protein [PVC group bacterium]
MKKIPTMFIRLPSGKMSKEINPVCDWVFKNEGIAHIKLDGTCCLYDTGTLYKRRTVKPAKTYPKDFIAVDYDENTGKEFGWVPVTEDDKWHVEAFEKIKDVISNGTYELIGPKIQGNPEKVEGHVLMKHELTPIYTFEPQREYNELKEWLVDKDIEGLIFYHSDGRMAKIKKSDFGLVR